VQIALGAIFPVATGARVFHDGLNIIGKGYAGLAGGRRQFAGVKFVNVPFTPGSRTGSGNGHKADTEP
jgi:hypothetical protein